MSWFRRRRPRPAGDPRPPIADADRARWWTWREEVFGDGYLVWHEGADTDASTARWRQDPAGTEAALALGLAADDHVAAEAVEAFARAGGAPGADLAAAVVTATGPGRAPAVRIAAAVAAHVLTGDPAFAEVVVSVLLARTPTRDGFTGPRETAARLLTAFPPTARIADALADAVVRDPEYLVRYHAVSSLLTLAGDAPDPLYGLRQAVVATISERGSAPGRAALAQDLRARVGPTPG